MVKYTMKDGGGSERGEGARIDPQSSLKHSLPLRALTVSFEWWWWEVCS